MGLRQWWRTGYLVLLRIHGTSQQEILNKKKIE
jgi:hypothetical protein